MIIEQVKINHRMKKQTKNAAGTAVLLALLLAVSTTGRTQSTPKTFTIKGTVSGVPDSARLFLLWFKNGSQAMRVMDTAIVGNGEFTYSGEIHGDIPEAIDVFLSRNGAAPGRSKGVFQTTEIYADPGEIRFSVHDSLGTAKVTGKTNEEKKQYMDFIRVPGGSDFDNHLYDVNRLSILQLRIQKSPFAVDTSASSKTAPPMPGAKIAKSGDLIRQNALMERRDSLIAIRKTLQKNYILAHPDSYFSLLALTELVYGNAVIDVASNEPLWNALSRGLQNSFTGQKIRSALDRAKANPGVDFTIEQVKENRKRAEERARPPFALGDTAPEFTMNDADGKPVHLSDFKGKYVLVDFWASWCVPCRAENPNVVKAYNEFKDKNFTVLGVALEQPGPSTNWLAAIKKDGLSYTEVSDFSYFNSPVAKMYKVQAIPQNFLIDPSGKVIAFHLKGDDLQKKLAELLNN
jgi:peroxiredoxin